MKVTWVIALIRHARGWVSGYHQNVTKRDGVGGWFELNVTSRLQQILGMNFPTVAARQINLAHVIDKK